MALLRYISVVTARASVARVAASGLLLRRSLLGFVLIAAAPLCPRVLADTAPADATAVIKHFNEALLTAMKTGEQSDFSHRFQALAPEVDQTFDLPVVLAVSGRPRVGRVFRHLSRAGCWMLSRRYTVASYLANFNRYARESFTVSSDTRSLAQVGCWCRAASCRSGATQPSLTM